MGRVTLLTIVLLSLFGTAASSVRAQNMPVPPALQAAILKKIFTLDRTLTEKKSADMLVVYASAGDSGPVLEAFKGAGLSVTAVSQDQLSAKIGEADIVYFLPGTTPSPQLSRTKGVLSLAGMPAEVEGGKAAVGIGLKDKKPEIIVHMGQLKAEGHELSSDLLKLARVIQ